MSFKTGDIVTTVDNMNRGVGIEAVVDFQKGNKVYISERGRTLANPIRYIVPAEILYKKEKGKLIISLKEMNALMSSQLHINNANYNDEPSIDRMNEGDVFYNDSNRYEYVGKLDGEIVWSCNGYFCVIEEEDIKKMFWTQESVCQQLFNLSKKDIEVTDI